MDLGNLDTLESSLDELIEAAKPFSQYDRIVIVNNAGSLGHLGKVTDMSSLKDLTDTVNLNVTSGIWFTTRWAKELQVNTNVTIVNTSSLCAVQAFPTMTTYCSGKAARNMFHESLAKESPLLKILNYAPGAMDTTMTVALREEEQLANGLKEYFRGAHAKGELIDPNTSAKKLVALVLSGDFESGKHVDYWDLPDP
jgi:sepiapterin reductase